FPHHNTPHTHIYTPSLHDALPISPYPTETPKLWYYSGVEGRHVDTKDPTDPFYDSSGASIRRTDTEISLFDEPDVSDDEDQYKRSEEHTSELQSRENLVCRLLLEK